MSYFSYGGRGTVKTTVPMPFTATETFDVGIDLGSPVSLDYADKAPFAFDGTIGEIHVRYSAPLSANDVNIAAPDSEGPIVEPARN